jgi:CubicO group peptidase (beta-lactamase class C family)
MACWLLGGLLYAPVGNADPVDDFVQAQLKEHKIPGLALLVMKNGEVVKQQGYGYADLEFNVPVTADTLFQSGSLGKQFTAAGILLLVEDGKLRLDDRLSMYFPDAPAAWHRITVRQLLSHTSGIKDYESADVFDYRKDITDEELLKAVQELPLEFEPGSQWNYSNSGYVILGLLTSKLAGKHWSDFQAERIFKPLGMKTTRVISERDIIPNRASGYQLKDGVIYNQDWVSPSYNYRFADGALYFSVKDLAEWERALEKGTFMSPGHFADWWTSAHLTNGGRYPYGFGWFLTEQRGQPVIAHTGSWQGFTTAIWRYPAQNMAVMVLTNSDDGKPSMFAREVAGLIDPTLKTRPIGTAPSGDASKADDFRRVLEAWSRYEVDPRMASSLAATATGSAAEAQSRKFVADTLKIGKPIQILGTDKLTKDASARIADGSRTAVDAVVQSPKGALRVRFHLDDRGRVVSFAPYD